MNYDQLLERKRHAYEDAGFTPVFMPDQLFDFQRALVEWSVKKGRAAKVICIAAWENLQCR